MAFDTTLWRCRDAGFHRQSTPEDSEAEGQTCGQTVSVQVQETRRGSTLGQLIYRSSRLLQRGRRRETSKAGEQRENSEKEDSENFKYWIEIKMDQDPGDLLSWVKRTKTFPTRSV